ncbi:MAG: tetratricopeptide repeat protein [Paludibacteraceae bacterium]|nr:tetratricopeptide repeat protein [Paludibacteraceae bacterium]
MKRLFLTVTVACCIFAVGNARSNISTAKDLALRESPDFEGAKEAINAALQDPETKDKAETWYVAGLVYEKIAEAETNKQMLGRQPDVATQGEAALKSYEYYLPAYKKDFIPNAKGKVKPKYARKIEESIRYYYNQGIIVNYGIHVYNERNYERAIDAFETHTAIPDLEMIKNSKNPIIKDSIYNQIKYHTAACASIIEDNQKAAAIYEEIKDKGYEGNRIHQFLYDIYSREKDTVNFVRTLKEGHEKYPEEQFFLGNLINYLIFNGKVDEGLAYLDEAIKNNPNNAEYYYVKGSVMEVLDKLDDAVTFFDKALSINPNLSAAWGRKGAIIMKTAMKMEENAANIKDPQLYNKEKANADAKFKEALPLFEKAVELNPEDIDNLKLLRGLYYRFKDTEKYEEINERINAL